MKCIRVILIFLMVLGVQCVYAQKKVTVVGEASYVVPGNMTMDEARRNALEQAKANALKSEFSEVVSQNTSTVVKVTNGQSDVRMLSQGGSSIKGEWIETIGEPEYSYGSVTEKGEPVIFVKVKGKAREIKGNKVDLQVKVLKNTMDLSNEVSEFQSGEHLYLYFRSPIPGYVTVYMEDDATHKVSCLLPYWTSKDQAFRVEANTDYLFFAHKRNPELYPKDYELLAYSGEEQETIYVVFSPNPFCKANADEHNMIFELTHDEFMKWLWKNEGMDKDMFDLQRHITVVK